MDFLCDGLVLFVLCGFFGDVIVLDIVMGNVLWWIFIVGVCLDYMDILLDGKWFYVLVFICGGDVVEVLDMVFGDKFGFFKIGFWFYDVYVIDDNENVYVVSLGDM